MTGEIVPQDRKKGYKLKRNKKTPGHYLFSRDWLSVSKAASQQSLSLFTSVGGNEI